MSILTAASSKSAWRGYEYFIEDKVQFVKKLDDTHFGGAVAGSETEPYHGLRIFRAVGIPLQSR